MDQYVTVNFTMMADLVNQIGGLELDVESDYIRDRINAVIKMDNKALGIDIDTDLLSSSGVQTLNGKQVQALARWRTGSSDFERTQRQREVIVAILEKLKNEFSLMQLMRLAATNFDNVYTNMSLATIMQLAPALFELDLSSIEQLRIPVDGAYKNQTVSGMAVLVPDRGQKHRGHQRIFRGIIAEQLMKKKVWRRMLSVLLILVLLGAAVGGALVACVYARSRAARPLESADCLIVLSARVWESGEPSDALQYRLDSAVEAYNGSGGAVIVCGAGGRQRAGKRGQRDEARAGGNGRARRMHL